MVDFYIGVDPGMTGAVAIIDGNRWGGVYDFESMQALTELMLVADLGFECIAAVEKTGARPAQGVSSMYKFGHATGRVTGWLEALGIPFFEVTPPKWQRGVYDSGVKMADKKAQSLNTARKLFPHMLTYLSRKKDHNRADALLLAEYCLRERGKRK